MDDAGHATATRAVSITKAETRKIHAQSDQTKNARHIRNGMLDVQWNIAALNEQIDLHEQFDSGIRARQFNREIRRGTVAGVFRHNTVDLIRDRVSSNQGYLNIIFAYCDFQPIAGLISGPGPEDLARALLFTKIVWPLLIAAGGFKYGDAITDPFSLTVRPFRAFGAAATLTSHQLVRAR